MNLQMRYIITPFLPVVIRGTATGQMSKSTIIPASQYLSLSRVTRIFLNRTIDPLRVFASCFGNWLLFHPDNLNESVDGVT